MKNGKTTMPPTEPKEVKTKAQKYLDLKAKLAQYESEAETEALDALKEPLSVLEQLGKPHVVISQGEYEALKAARTHNLTAKAPKGAGGGKPSTPPADGYNAAKSCAVCGGIPGHDGRKHRLHKQAFTAAELAEMGLTPPPGTPTRATL